MGRMHPSAVVLEGSRSVRDNRFAMRLSLAVGVLMLAGKSGAWWLTGSSAILSDAVESVVHVLAVGFAVFSLNLSLRPASMRFPFGYERITFFSAGFEGAAIVLAAAVIGVAAVQDLLHGVEVRELGLGTLLVATAALVNGMLGWFLIRTGKRTQSLILEANGTHVLTDTWTSLGVVVGLLLVQTTGWLVLDPLCAIAVAASILWSGGKLIYRSVGGLMDYVDPQTGALIRRVLEELCQQLGVSYHGLRFRSMGHRLKVEFHLLFPAETPLGEAHRIATRLEALLPARLGRPADVTTHLEAIEDHGQVHQD
jgi:cation diffusion facilitator family transporter